MVWEGEGGGEVDVFVDIGDFHDYHWLNFRFIHCVLTFCSLSYVYGMGINIYSYF